MSKKSKLLRVRHTSLDMADPEIVKKKQDVLSKAKSKLMNLSDALKSSKNLEVPEQKKGISRSMTQVTLDYFFKHGSNREKNHIYANTRTPANGNRSTLRKQNSVDSCPIRIEISGEDDDTFHDVISRTRPATVCGDALDAPRDADALALERPRKKLSFRDPEILGTNNNKSKVNGSKHNGYFTIGKKVERRPSPKNRNCNANGILHRKPSFEDCDLESQAMRVVRTVGQAFEVCHKLSINAPENDHLDNDEQDTLTQDLLSDRLSDITSDKPKKDIISEGASDRMSLPPDDNSVRDFYSESNTNMRPPPQIDILAPPPNSNPQKPALISAETYASPHSDGLANVNLSSSGNGVLPPAGSALSAHHEIQLLREQLEQQSQQTQAAMAQLQLVREQLAAEQSARLEAQARTHQLLVHNRELLDHIAALVAHLQGGEKPGQQQTPPHMAMPQHQHYSGPGDLSEGGSLDNSILQTLGLNPQGLIENRAVTSCLPSSPLRSGFNTGGNVFNFPYAQPVDTPSFESQLLQRLSASYNPPSHFPYNYNQTLPYLPPSFYSQPLLNNNYTLQPPPQKKIQQPSPLMMPHSFPGNGTIETRLSPARSSEPKQIPTTQFQSQQSTTQFQQQQNPHYQQTPSNSHNQSSQHLQVQQNVRQQREASPNPHSSPHMDRREGQFIKPLAQIGTLTTTDSDGRMRIIVPIPSNSNEDAGNLLANLRITDDFRPLNGPPITRSTSEKVPNRSELMSQVQRTAWARHTTK